MGLWNPFSDKLSLLLSLMLYSSCRILVYYRTWGGEWRGCIAATPYFYIGQPSVKASMIGAFPWPVNLSLPKLTRFRRMTSPANCFTGGTLCLKSFVTTAAALTSTKPGSKPALVLPFRMAVQSISKPAFLPFPRAQRISCLPCQIFLYRSLYGVHRQVLDPRF